MGALPYRSSSEPSAARPVELTPEKSAAALRGFFRIIDAWQIGNDDARVLLGRPGRATFFHWKKGDVKNVPYDTICRISYILGVWKALQILFQAPATADAWIRKPNRLFGGQSALNRMLAGDITDLAAVRSVLDSARGGGV